MARNISVPGAQQLIGVYHQTKENEHSITS